LLVIQKSLAAQIRELNPEYQEQQERLARVRSGLNNLITPQQRIRQQVRELREEYRAGNVTYDDTVKRMRQLREEHRKLGIEQDKEEQKRSRFVQGLRNQTFALVRQISAITLMYKAIRQLQEGFADALEIGRSQRQFETFTGSATVASRLMSDIRQFTAETPVTLGAAQQAVRTLLQYNVDQDQVINRLRQLGDISGGSTESLQRLSLAFGQITANTRLQGQELRQLIEAGFNPLQVISEQTGETMFDLRQRMADGTISFKEVGQALDSATSDAGRFANALQNIATETDFGRLQRFRSEFEKLRADIMIPITAAAGAVAGKSLDQLDEYRSQVKEKLLFDPDADLEAKEIDKTLKLLDVFSGIAMIPLEAKKRMIDAVIEEQRRAIKATKEQVNSELKELLEANESQSVSNSEVEDSIHEKIAALREEAEVLRLGADEAEVQQLRRQGVSNEYIAQLRKEMQIVNDLKSKQKEQDDAEKKLHDERLKRIRERELAEKKSIQDRERDLQNQKKQAEAMAEAIMTPLERLEQEMAEIQKLSRFLTVQQRVKLMDKAKERFEAELAERNRSGEAAAVTRGSVEEFKLVAQINKTQVSQQQRLHDEAQGERKKTNTKLDLQIKALDLLPLELGEEMAGLMAQSVS
jgi:tape measure domain-containing protein